MWCLKGGSRTSIEDATKRYLCDRTDLKKKKALGHGGEVNPLQEEGGEFSYTQAAKDMEEGRLEERRAFETCVEFHFIL